MFWLHDPASDWDIRGTFYEAYRKEREVANNFDEIEKYFRIETLAWLVAGLIVEGEVTKEQKEFYKEKLQKELVK